MDVKFDLQFQLGLLKLMLEEDYFCSQMARFLGEDDDLKEFIIFDSDKLQDVFLLIVTAFRENAIRPTVATLRQRLSHMNEKRAKELLAVFDALEKVSVRDDDVYRKEIQTFVQRSKFLKGMKKVHNIYKGEDGRKKKTISESLTDAHAKMQEVLDNINQVSFEKDDVITLDEDLTALIDESSNAMKGTIPTGITDLDADLHGGLPRETLVTVLAGTNVGKSMFCVALAKQALQAKDPVTGQELGHRVLYIPLEGMRAETPLRFTSALAEIDYADLISGNLDKEQKARIEHVKNTYGKDRLRIKNMMDFNVTIEQVAAHTRELYKEFPFDMLVIDYGQLLETQQATESHRFTMAKVYRGLAALAREFGAVVISPVQATRQGQESQNLHFNKNQDDRLPVLRSSDISEAFEIARVSGVIISLNMTDDERPEGKLRVFLEKQRHGMKGKSYGLLTDYPRCNLITGNFFDANSMMIQGDSFMEGLVEDGDDTFDLETALGKGENDALAQKIEKLNGMMSSLEKDEHKLQKLIKDIEKEKESNPLEADEEDSIVASMIVKQKKLADEIKEKQQDYFNFFQSVYPTAHESHMEPINQSIAKLEEQRQTARIKENVEELKALKARYILWLKVKALI